MADGKIANAEVCDDNTCAIGNLLVRGDVISFVTPERVEQAGEHPLDEEKMPSDITIPKGYVLVHDTAGIVLNRCDLYIVRWHTERTRRSHNKHIEVDKRALEDAVNYFGTDTRITTGRVDIPKGPWHRAAQVTFIRYRRVGDRGGSYEHKYEPNVDLMYCTKPLAWRLPLPQGCIVDERGFVFP